MLRMGLVEGVLRSFGRVFGFGVGGEARSWGDFLVFGFGFGWVLMLFIIMENRGGIDGWEKDKLNFGKIEFVVFVKLGWTYGFVVRERCGLEGRCGSGGY